MPKTSGLNKTQKGQRKRRIIQKIKHELEGKSKLSGSSHYSIGHLINYQAIYWKTFQSVKMDRPSKRQPTQREISRKPNIKRQLGTKDQSKMYDPV